MNDAVYRVEGAGYAYDGIVALRDISFVVRSGDSLAVLGANGSGKSTLLKMLNGLIFPSEGRVEFMGTELAEGALRGDFLRCFRERVGFVFSEPDVQLFCPTVYDELAFGPVQLGLDTADVKKRVKELLEMLGIVGLAERAPYTLSSGEKKKVAIAAALSANPDVLLLDEPTNGLDPRTQVWLFALFESLKALNKTFVMATHDLSLVEDLAARAVVLDESHRVVSDGPAATVLRDKDLLLRANIIHEHAHRHGDITHIHSHGPYSTHDEHD